MNLGGSGCPPAFIYHNCSYLIGHGIILIIECLAGEPGNTGRNQNGAGPWSAAHIRCYTKLGGRSFGGLTCLFSSTTAILLARGDLPISEPY